MVWPLFCVFHTLICIGIFFALCTLSPPPEVHMAIARPLLRIRPRMGAGSNFFGGTSQGAFRKQTCPTRSQASASERPDAGGMLAIRRQTGIKAEVDHRRWCREELDEARELLRKYSVEEVAKRLNRSPKALRSALQRRQLRVREIRCDCFSLESLAQTLHVRRSEVSAGLNKGGYRQRSPSGLIEASIGSRPKPSVRSTSTISKTC